ncbi:hypothetical protein D3C79_913190 [compost metagenome]
MMDNQQQALAAIGALPQQGPQQWALFDVEAALGLLAQFEPLGLVGEVPAPEH